MDFDGVVNEIIEESGYPQKKAAKKSTAGRKNTGKTAAHYEQIKNDSIKTAKIFRHTKQSDNFEIIENCPGSVVDLDNLAEFKELYTLTCNTILEDFKRDNTELCKKHPYNWYKKVLLQIKKAVPRITPDDFEKIIIVWDCLADLLYNMGLYPTYELFQLMTGIYKFQLEKRAGVKPKYMDLLKKMSIEADSALISELAMSPYNSTNKIFLAKVHGIIEKTEPKQVEVVHRVQGLDDIPIFGIEQKPEN